MPSYKLQDCSPQLRFANALVSKITCEDTDDPPEFVELHILRDGKTIELFAIVTALSLHSPLSFSGGGMIVAVFDGAAPDQTLRVTKLKRPITFTIEATLQSQFAVDDRTQAEVDVTQTTDIVPAEGQIRLDDALPF